MYVAFTESRTCDAHKLCLGMKLIEIFCPYIPHGGAKASGQLMQHGYSRALVRHLAFNAFRHELECILDILLEVAVGRSARHRADRAHASIGLVGASLIEEHFAGRFVRSGE